MEVIRAAVLGCCAGVQSALQKAESLLEKGDSSVFSFGPLIHNDNALNDLYSRGLVCVNEADLHQVSQVKNASVIIRAHGISPGQREKLVATGAKIVDCTCPRVLLSQNKAAEFAEKGYTVILAGEKNHGELTGIAGFCRSVILVENSLDAENLPFVPEKAVLISQTTIAREEFRRISETLSGIIPHLEVCNMICPATKERQDALRALSELCDAVIVVGGKNSANTKRLFLSAQKLFRFSVCIENSSEIPREFYGFNTVGIAAGASTPEKIIFEVENNLKKGINV